ncbi:hypothetical protein TW65_06619 [Stemphylium lycopersici]|nr:hypothetical protein TW65_06619 [Stemphylium lycopersici]
MSIPRYHFQALATNTTKLMLTMTSLLAPSDILSLRFEAGEPENNKSGIWQGQCDYGTSYRITSDELAQNAPQAMVSACPEINWYLYQYDTYCVEGLTGCQPRREWEKQHIGAAIRLPITQYGVSLQAGHTYDLQFSKNSGGVFACCTDELDERLKKLPLAQKSPVGREGGKCSFIVYDNLVPPRIFARLEIPAQVHLTDPIPFTLVIKYTTDSLNPIVVDKPRSSLSILSNELTSLDSLIDFRDSKTGEKVPWCAVSFY